MHVRCNMSLHTFYGIRTDPTRALKIVNQHFTPRMHRMHYVTHDYNGMQKHKLGITCYDTLFVLTAPSPPENEKYNFSVSCPGPLFMETASGPPSMKNSASMFHIIDSPDAKTQVWGNVSRHCFYVIHIGPTRACKIVHRHFAPGCTKMHYVTNRSHRMQNTSLA
jgi:hypothetical protein